MAVDLSVMNLLASPLPRFLFQEVMKDRSVRFEELLKRVQRPTNREDVQIVMRSIIAGADKETTDELAVREAIRGKLQELKDAHLIKELVSPIEDFNTYYITADGLEASRKLRL